MRFCTMPAILTYVGGKSFQLKVPDEKQSLFLPRGNTFDTRTNRRGIYMARGYIPSTDVMANFLLSFDVDDGRTPCPVRGQTVTAPAGFVHHERSVIEAASAKLAHRMLEESRGDFPRLLTCVSAPPWTAARPGGIGSRLTFWTGIPSR